MSTGAKNALLIALQELWQSLSEIAKTRWAAFRKKNKYFQYRVYIITAFSVLMLATFIVVQPKRVRNRLGATVMAAKGDFVVGAYILIRNDSGDDWLGEVRVNLNGTHDTRIREGIKRGQQVTLKVGQFVPKKMASPTLSEAEVHTVWIKCSEGIEKYAVKF